MKIEDILLENDTLKEVDGLKPEERLGSRIGNWLKKKFTTDPIADKTRAAAARRARGGDPTTSTVVKTKKAPTPMDAGEFASAAPAPTPMDAGEFASAATKAVAKPSKDLDSIVFPSEKKLAQQKLDKYDDRAMRLARQDKGGREATLDNTPKPASIVARDKYAGRDTNRGLDVGRGRDMSNADAIAQAGAKFTQNTPVAKPSKYPKGDIRNLGKYFKPANVTNQGGKKMAGDVEAPKKGVDLRNLLKLAGVSRPDGSAKDNK